MKNDSENKLGPAGATIDQHYRAFKAGETTSAAAGSKTAQVDKGVEEARLRAATQKGVDEAMLQAATLGEFQREDNARLNAAKDLAASGLENARLGDAALAESRRLEDARLTAAKDLSDSDVAAKAEDDKARFGEAMKAGSIMERARLIELHERGEAEQNVLDFPAEDEKVRGSRGAELWNAGSSNNPDEESRSIAAVVNLGVQDERQQWQEAYANGRGAELFKAKSQPAESAAETQQPTASTAPATEAKKVSTTSSASEKAVDTQPASRRSASAAASVSEKGAAFDNSEMLSPELKRGPNGEMKSTYIEMRDQKSNRANGVFTFERHVELLRKSSANADAPEMKQRFELQAKFEETQRALMTSPTHLRAIIDGRPGTRETMLKSATADHQVELAMLDLKAGSSQSVTADSRLQASSTEPRSVWEREVHDQTGLRSTLKDTDSARYDNYLDKHMARMVEQTGNKDYAMSREQMQVWDDTFERFTADLRVQAEQKAAAKATATAQAGSKAVAGEGQPDQKAAASTAPRSDWDQEVNRTAAASATKPDNKALAGGDVNGLASKPGDASKVSREVPVEGFSATRAEDGRSIDYRQTGEQAIAFRDIGERVSIATSKRADPSVLRGALTVAASKFERLSLNGSTEFRETAAREAVSIGLGDRISNPELKDFVAKEQKRQEAQRLQGATQGASQGVAAEGRPLSAERDVQQGAKPAVDVAQEAVAGAKQGAPTKVADEARLTSEALHETASAAQQKAEARDPEAGTEEFPVKRMASASDKGRATGGTEEFPVTLPRESKDTSRSKGTDEFPVKVMSSGGSAQSITGAQTIGGRSR